MRTIGAADLLNLWESVSGMHPALGSLAVACLADPTLSREAAARLPIGERDRLILLVRRAVFGSKGQALADCRACGQRAEFVLDLDALLEGIPPLPETFEIEIDGLKLELRLPSTQDLLALTRVPLARAKRTLFSRVLVRAESPVGPLEEKDISDATIALAGERLAEKDALAALEIAMDCPFCGAAISHPFDAGRYFLSELQAWSIRTFQEVHYLAKAYGWNEAEVLGLTARRRRLYLEMARG